LTILVIGATGVIGSRVTRELLHRGEVVRAVVRNDARAAALPPGTEVAVADLNDQEAVIKAATGAERVVLIVANSPDQVHQESNVIEAARLSGVSHLVKLSVGGASADAALALARDHWAAEEHLRTAGVPSTIVRPGFFMQNLLQYAPWIAADGTWTLPMGDLPIAMVDAVDVASVVASVALAEPLDNDPIVTGPAALTMVEAAATISAASGRSIRYVDGDPETYYARLVGEGTDARYARDLTTLYDQIIRAGYAGVVSPDASTILGREPMTFARFAADNSEAFNKA
jgi:uncharacterized protein YbjT (DUF2867 family)